MSSEQLEYNSFVRQLLSRNKPNIRAKWRSMKATIETRNETLSEAEQVRVPSYGRFKKASDEIKEFEKLAGHNGIETAVGECQAVGEGVLDVERALQEVEIDHWRVGLRTILTKARIWHRLNHPSQPAEGPHVARRGQMPAYALRARHGPVAHAQRRVRHPPHRDGGV